MSEFVSTADGHDEFSTEEKAWFWLHSATARARSLAWGVAHCINAGLSPGAYLAARAHFEMTGLLAYGLREATKWREGKLTPEAFDALMVRFTQAQRVPASGDAKDAVAEGIRAINALTMLSAVGAVDETDPGGGFKASYEWLSELCHPNMLGHAVSIRRPEPHRWVFPERTFTRTDLDHLLGHARLTFDVFLRYHERISALLAETR